MIDRDEQLAVLLEQLAERQRRGEAIDLASEIDRAPELADELPGLWAAYQMADALAAGTRAEPPAPPAWPSDAPEEIPGYTILRELGRGGMGVVYLARQKSLGRLVAVKMILRGSFASATDLARFRGEATAAARLVHPNIVTVYEVGEHAGQPFLGMQYVAGPTLAERLKSGPLPPREAARLIADLARAVQFAHDNGVIHRDLKPSNILLENSKNPLTETSRHSGPDPSDRNGLIGASVVPKVTDFGLAKLFDESDDAGRTPLTHSGAIVGTPSYMAPEQASADRRVGPAADVYALGAILYECLTGRPPFQAATPLDTLLLVLEQEPVAPRLLNPGVPRELETICLKCLEKSPTRRYPRASHLADDLEAYLNGEAISAVPSGLAYFFDRAFRETHHAIVLENWGLLWMWHSLVTFLLCLVTQLMHWYGPDSHAAYLALWGIGLAAWGTIFWELRKRGGTVRFVERQVAHAWAAGVCASVGMFVIEVLLGEPPLTFSPLLAVAAGMVFLFKAGILTGIFYIAAAALFVTSLLMAVEPFRTFSVLMFGATVSLCFFLPGLKYHRQRLRTLRSNPTD